MPDLGGATSGSGSLMLAEDGGASYMAFYLDMHYVYSMHEWHSSGGHPPLPLVIDYQYAAATIAAQDELGIFHAIQLRDRIHRVVPHILPSVLDQLLVLIDDPFPVLEHLSLSSTAEEDAIPLLPRTFLTPNLRHLTLLGIGLPKELLFPSSTASVSLVTLTLISIQAFGYILPSTWSHVLYPFPVRETICRFLRSLTLSQR